MGVNVSPFVRASVLTGKVSPMQSMQDVIVSWVRGPQFSLNQLIVLAAQWGDSGRDVTVYVLDPDKLDPQDRPLYEETMARSELGAFLQRIIDGVPLPIVQSAIPEGLAAIEQPPVGAPGEACVARDTSHTTPPSNDPKVTTPRVAAVLKYASALRFDEGLAQVEITETGTTVIDSGAAPGTKGSSGSGDPGSQVS